MTDGRPQTTHPNRRSMLFGGSAMVTAATLMPGALAQGANQSQPAASSVGGGGKPNILVIFGDDIGQSNISAYTFGLMGYRTPSIDRIAHEGIMFTDYYAEQSCTAGRASFITG
jgi:Sulfatase